MLIGTVLFLSLIVILLAMPVTLTFRFSWKETLSAKLRLNWAFGLVHADVSPDPEKPSADKKEAHRKKDVWRPGGFRKTTNVVAAIQQPRFRRRMLRFMADLWHAVHKKNVWLRVRLGLGEFCVGQITLVSCGACWDLYRGCWRACGTSGSKSNLISSIRRSKWIAAGRSG